MPAIIRFATLAIALLAVPTTYAMQADPHATEEQAAQRQALGFLGYLDQGRYADSYDYTGMLIRNQADRTSFAQQLQTARAGVGALQQRTLNDVTYSTTVPGAPQGQYVVLALPHQLRPASGRRRNPHPRVRQRLLATRRLLHPVTVTNPARKETHSNSPRRHHGKTLLPA